MKATAHNTETRLHLARFRLRFDTDAGFSAARSAAQLTEHGDQTWIARAMDMYFIAAAVAEAGEDLPSDALEMVRQLRESAQADVLERQPEGYELRPFQRDGAGFLAKTREALLADEMGLGKTVQALMAIPTNACGMIVAPRSLVGGWIREAKIWRPDLNLVSVGRTGLRAPGADEFLVATPDAVREFHSRHGLSVCTGDPVPGTVIILDEAHYYKNSQAARTQAIRALVSNFDIRWALTGTPIDNKPEDLWGSLSSVGIALRMFGSRENFERIFGGVKIKTGEMKWAREPVDPEALRSAFHGRALRRMRRTVAPEIPKKVYTIVHQDTFPPFEENTRGGRFEEGSLDAKFGEPLATVRRKLAESKVSTMFDVVDRVLGAGNALVVFSSNVGPLESLAERYGCDLVVGNKTAEARSRAVDRFQNGETKLIGLQTVAGGAGLTLTAAHHLLYVQRDFSPANGNQAEDRICRLGQNEPCVIIDILTDHPLDLIIRQVLERKARLVSASTGAIQSQV